jgi:hypothetical protein
MLPLFFFDSAGLETLNLEEEIDVERFEKFIDRNFFKAVEDVYTFFFLKFGYIKAFDLFFEQVERMNINLQGITNHYDLPFILTELSILINACIEIENTLEVQSQVIKLALVLRYTKEPN